MKTMLRILVLMLPLLAANAWSEEATPSALTCDDFVATQEALDRFPDLEGACEAVVERDGELYGLFTAVVRRPGSRSVTLYLPVTDHTFQVEPQDDARVLIDGRKVRPRDLQRGQEIRVYLAARTFSTPDIEEIAFVTESEVLIEHPVVRASALPTTASLLPALGLMGLLLLGAGIVMRRLRLNDLS
jgi:hypothetical protein